VIGVVADRVDDWNPNASAACHTPGEAPVVAREGGKTAGAAAVNRRRSLTVR